tara:strand:- start:1777 stop:2349 length:573 start_codon:yes stop_codon:yes gene_type:complete
MQIESLHSKQGKLLDGLKLIKPKIYQDERGFFLESWNKKSFFDRGLDNLDFIQDNHSYSHKGVFRGFHYQLPPYPQTKLVRCIVGEIFDIAIDIRRSSSSFGHWAGVNLTSTNFHQLWVPEGFAHGFLTLSEKAEVLYKVTNYWHKDCERIISWKDPSLSIDFPFNGSLKLSYKDDNAPCLTELSETDIF